MKKIFHWIKNIWKDNVLGQIIALGIIGLIGIIWAWYKKMTPDDLYKLLIKILNFPIQLYLILSFVGLIFIIRLIQKYFKKKSDPLYDEIVGNYTFRELCLVLQNEKIETQTILMEWNKVSPKDSDLLSQFIVFAPSLNQGVTFEFPHDDSAYLYALFAPKMMTYGLVDKLQGKHHSGIDMEIYQLSDLGKRFLALWDKHRLKVDKKIK